VSALRVLTVSFADLQLAPTIKTLTISTSKTSVTATLQLSASGTAYCGVSPGVQGYRPSSVDKVLLQNFAASTVPATNTSMVVISGLSAVTGYSVFCLTASSVGVKMSMDKMLASQRDVTTACCKSVTASLSTSVLFEGQGVGGLLTALYALVVTANSTSCRVEGVYPESFTVS
jgi:hypothetical protein